MAVHLFSNYKNQLCLKMNNEDLLNFRDVPFCIASNFGIDSFKNIQNLRESKILPLFTQIVQCKKHTYIVECGQKGVILFNFIHCHEKTLHEFHSIGKVAQNKIVPYLTDVIECFVDFDCLQNLLHQVNVGRVNMRNIFRVNNHKVFETFR